MTQRALHQNAPALSTQKTTDFRLPPPPATATGAAANFFRDTSRLQPGGKSSLCAALGAVGVFPSRLLHQLTILHTFSQVTGTHH